MERGLVQRELARRALARRELLAFAWYTFRGYQAAAVHQALAWHLQEVERYAVTRGREGIGRLMVFMPPRHGKSELVSVRFPAWFLGRNPELRVIMASCTGDLATGFSRQVRDIINDVPFQAVFGENSGLPAEEQVRLSADSRAASGWELAGHRGGLVAAGVGGSIVGRGANLGIIDDPIKNRQEAESEATREQVDAWYRSTFYTRLEDGAAVVLMHQRWHGDDLAGRLLRRMVDGDGDGDTGLADQWVVLNLPAIAEAWSAGEGLAADEIVTAARNGWWKGADVLGRKPGEALWPEKYGLEALEAIKANVGLYEWEAMYQQRPQRIEGAMIRAYQILKIRTDEVPVTGIKWVRYWDLAVSGKERADFISGAKVGRTEDGRLFIAHVARLKGPWADARGRMAGIMRADGASVLQGIEVSGQQGGYLQELQRDPGLQGVPLLGVNPNQVGGKEVRAQVWASRIQDGLVHLVVANGWDVEAFLSECIAFPLGAHDDQVDAVSGAVQMLGGQVAEELTSEDPGEDFGGYGGNEARGRMQDARGRMQDAGRTAITRL